MPTPSGSPREELGKVGLGERLSHYPAQLSGGEQQRVALARALAPNPAILVADEPTGNLDEATGKQIIDLLFAGHVERGTTLVLVTHDNALAQRCDRDRAAALRPDRRRRATGVACAVVQRSGGDAVTQAAITIQPANRVPLWLKLAFTAFMAVLVPVYWYYYGPTNFLYFCDVALFLTLAGLWLEQPAADLDVRGRHRRAADRCGCIDFLSNLVGFPLLGMTDYMFKHENSLFLRGLSLFHGWIPFLLVYLVWQIGYDRRLSSPGPCWPGR